MGEPHPGSTPYAKRGRPRNGAWTLAPAAVMRRHARTVRASATRVRVHSDECSSGEVTGVLTGARTPGCSTLPLEFLASLLLLELPHFAGLHSDRALLLTGVRAYSDQSSGEGGYRPLQQPELR